MGKTDREDLDISKVYNFISNNFEIIDIYQGQEENRVYYGNSNNRIWLENGFYFEKHSFFDRFGNNTVGSTLLHLGNIVLEKTICIVSKEMSRIDGVEENDYYFIVDRNSAKEELIGYIDSLKQEILKDDVIKYIRRFDGDMSLYLTLNDELKRDKDIIDSVIIRIFEDSYREYREIKDYYMISPYGGEDIVYFPESASHCFMDNIKTRCEMIGLTKVISQNGMRDIAYKTMIEKGETDYLRDKIKNYDKKADLFLLKGEVLEFVEKYKELLYIVGNDDVYYDFCSYEDKKQDIDQKVEIITLQLNELQNRKFTWIERTILKRKEYEDIKAQIPLIIEEIKELQNRLIVLKEEYEPMLSDRKKYKELGRKINEKCYKYFEELNIPRDTERVENYFEEINKFIEENKEEYEFIKKLLNS